MSPLVTLILYCALLLIASLVGGWIPFILRLTHKRMELAISFVGGAMLGVGVLLLLPHAFLAKVNADETEAHAAVHDHHAAHEFFDSVMLWLLLGFLAMFLIERFFCFHHHDAPDHEHASKHRHKLTWGGATIGLALHSLIDGIALAASVEVAARHTTSGIIAGFGTFLVIALHKPFDSLTIGTLMAAGNKSNKSRHIVNVAFSLLIPVGVLLFYAGLSGFDEAWLFMSGALAFSAGTFLCIAMSDLLPELQFHQHDRIKLTLSMLAGLAVAWMISIVEGRVH